MITYYLLDRHGNLMGDVVQEPWRPAPKGRWTRVEPPPADGASLVWTGAQWLLRNEPVTEALPDPADLLAARKAEMKSALAQRRWEAETAGITVGGGAIATDRESQAMITGAFTRAQDKLAQGQTEDTIWFKGVGGWVQLDIPTTMAIGRAVGDHVQACFAHERDLDALIDAAEDDAALDAIDIEAGWPGQD